MLKIYVRYDFLCHLRIIEDNTPVVSVCICVCKCILKCAGYAWLVKKVSSVKKGGEGGKY